MRMFGRQAEENPEPIDPQEAVTNALGLVGEQLRLAGIEIVTELAQDCPCVLGHTIQMEQVVLNLLTNARDALAERDGEAKITVRVFEDDKGVHITSEDTGGGYSRRCSASHLRAVLHNQRNGQRHGLRLVCKLWHYP